MALFSLFLSQSALISPAESIGFADGAPAGMTDTASSTNGTYRDSDGEMQTTPASTPIVNHDISGEVIGLQCFPARTNLCTNNNAVISATTNISVTGDATIGTVSDITELENQKLRDVVTSSVFEASGGAAGGTVVIAGGIGATGDCSASLYARVTVGASASFGITPDATNTTISGSAYALFEAEGMTATNTADTLVITVPAGVTIRFCLNQLETGKKATPAIVVAGSSATTVKNFPQMPIPAGFNIDEGVIIVEAQAIYDANQPSAAGVLLAHSSESAFPTDNIYLQSNQTSHQLNSFAKGNNASVNIAAPTAYLADRPHPVAIIYTNGGAVRTVGGPMVTTNTTVTMTDTAADIDTLTFGAFANNSGQFKGWIKSVKFFDQAYTMNQIATNMLGSKTGNSERGIAFAGQSNSEGYFAAATVFTNGGERAIIEDLNAAWGEVTRNWGINGATGGSSFTAWEDDGDAPLERFLETVRNFRKAGGVIEALVWDQGESDMGFVASVWESRVGAILENLRAACGSVPVYIVQGGIYRLNTTDTQKNNCYEWKYGHQLIAENNSWCKLLPPKMMQPNLDGTHLTDAGYTEQGHIIARFIMDDLGETVSGGVTPPSITSAVLDGDDVVFTITHGDGTDFTPTTAIAGFEMFDDGVRVDHSAAVRTDATTLTVTLSATPSGTVTYRYGMGSGVDFSGSNEDPANFVRDNSTPYNLPLIYSFGTAEAFSPADVASLSGWYDATDSGTITESSGAVSQWDDKSSFGRDLTQGTGIRQPQTGTRTQNSLNVIDFNGDILASSAFTEETQVNTVYIAGVFDTTSNQYMLDGLGASTRNGFLVLSSNYNLLAGSFGAGAAADTSFHIFKLVYDSTSSIMGVDGTDATVSAGTQGTDGVVIGASKDTAFFLNGAIGEILRFDGALSAGDEANVEAYLQRWIP